MSRMSIQGSLNTDLLKQSKYHESRIQEMYSFPANMKKAQIHQKANAFGYNPSFTDKNRKIKPAICPCCQLPINTQAIDLYYATTPLAQKVKKGGDVYLLNSGTSMFFTFIKMSVIYLLIRFLITDIYNLISSTTGTYCDDSNNNCSTFANLSAFNKKTQKDEGMVNVVDVLNMICVIVSIVFFILYRKFQFKIYNIAETSSFSQDDYTIFVEDIPIFIPQIKGKQIPYQRHIKDVFEERIKSWIDTVKKLPNQRKHGLQRSFYSIATKNDFDKKPIVRSVSLCFDLTEMEKMKKLRQSLMEEHINNVASKIDVPDSKDPNYVPNQIKAVNGQYIELSKRFSIDQSAAFNLSHFVGKAYVSFEYQHYCELLLKQYQANNQIQLNGKALAISTASQPSDVYWFNMRIDNNDRKKSIFKSYLVLIMTLTFAFGALLGLQSLQLNHAPGHKTTPAGQTNPATPESKQNVLLSYGFTLLMTVLINVVNYILTLTIDTLTQSQRQQSKTDEITSLMIKYIMAQFFNTALIYYIISLMNPAIGPLSQNGIVVKIMSLVAVSGVVNIVMNALQLGSLVTWLLNKWNYNKKTQVDLFQKQLNQNLQDPEFNFAQRYSYYIVQVYVVSFYACIAPSITIILGLIFVAQYWVDKFNLFKQRFSCPTQFNFQLSRLTLKIFEVSMLVFAIGNLIFSPQIHVSQEETYHIFNWITFGLAFIFVTFAIFLPKKWQQKLFYYETAGKQSYTFCLKGNYFNKFYFRLNPATSFAKERDLNNQSEFVNYGDQNKRIASQIDLDNYILNLAKNESIVQKYDERDEQVVQQILQDFAGQLEADPSKK